MIVNMDEIKVQDQKGKVNCSFFPEEIDIPIGALSGEVYECNSCAIHRKIDELHIRIDVMNEKIKSYRKIIKNAHKSILKAKSQCKVLRKRLKELKDLSKLVNRGNK